MKNQQISLFHDHVKDYMAQSEFVWTPDSEATFCALCSVVFGLFNRKHHCRKCGKVLCNKCTPFRMKVPEHGFTTRVRVCTKCCQESMHAPKLTTSSSSQSPQETYIIPLNDDALSPSSLPSSRHNSFTFASPPKSPRHSLSPTHKSQPLPSRPKSMHISRAPPPPSQPALPPSSLSSATASRPHLISSNSVPLSLSPVALDGHFTLPPNWENLEPMHFGPLPTTSFQYQIPVGSKTVELPNGTLFRGLKGFTYKSAAQNAPVIPLHITLPYVPAHALATSHGPAHAAITKTGPALCMAPHAQHWARGMLCVDGTRVVWRAREGDAQEFALSADAVLMPVDRGSQIKGMASKADGILGISDKAHDATKDEARTIWYFHFPSREIRNTWRFSMTFNIAHAMSSPSQFGKVKTEFIRALAENGVPDAAEFNWKEILDVLYSDE